MLPPILGPSVYEVPYRGTSRLELPLHPRRQLYIRAQLLQTGAHSRSKTGEIVRRTRERAVLFVMEPGLDVLGVNFLKYVKKLNCLVYGEVVKKL